MTKTASNATPTSVFHCSECHPHVVQYVHRTRVNHKAPSVAWGWRSRSIRSICSQSTFNPQNPPNHFSSFDDAFGCSETETMAGDPGGPAACLQTGRRRRACPTSRPPRPSSGSSPRCSRRRSPRRPQRLSRPAPRHPPRSPPLPPRPPRFQRTQLPDPNPRRLSQPPPEPCMFLSHQLLVIFPSQKGNTGA